MKKQSIINISLILLILSILLFIFFLNNNQQKPEKSYTIIKNYKADNNISKEKRVSFYYDYSNLFFILRQKDIKINGKTRQITLAMLTDRFTANLLIDSSLVINSDTGVMMFPYDIFVGDDKVVIPNTNNYLHYPNFIKLIDEILNDKGEIEVSINLEKVMFVDENNLISVLK